MLRALPLALFAGCQPGDEIQLVRLNENPVPDFVLVDDNPASATYGQDVSPRDLLDRATAWYFGHST